VTANLGHVKNEGYEIELDFARTTPGGFRYNIGYALSFSKDLIIRKSDTELSPSYQKEAGYAIDQPRVYMHEGVINSWNDVYTGVLGQSRNDLLPGAFRQIDFNNDGIISVDDQAPYGFTPRPQYSYSPKFGIGYKGLDLNVDFYGVFNVEGQSMAMQGAFGFQQDILYNVHREIAWFPELGIGEEAQLPAPSFLSGGGVGLQTFFTPRSYLRLKNVNLSYNINPQILSQLGVSNMRLYVNGENLLLWSKMYIDRETNAGFANRSYPMLKRVTFGLNLNF
jgi:hypothetical protein